MTEQPSPEPEKAKSAAAPKSNSASSGVDSSKAHAYVPLPERTSGQNRGVLALAALLAAGALAGAAVHFRAPSGSTPIVIAAARQNKLITVTDADISATATARVRRSSGAGPTTIEAGAASVPATPIAPTRRVPAGDAPVAAPVSAAPVENRASSPLPVVPPEIISPAASAPQSVLTAQGLEAVRSDGYSIFSMRLVDDVVEDGDVVLISIDGVPMSYLSLSHAGATLDIPLKKGESHQIKITAVRDGTGGVTLGLQTSAGTIVSRNMAVGESDSWTVEFK